MKQKIFWAGPVQCAITWIIRSGVVQKPLKFKGCTTLFAADLKETAVQQPLKFKGSTTSFMFFILRFCGAKTFKI